jgi:hypothetical protein
MTMSIRSLGELWLIEQPATLSPAPGLFRLRSRFTFEHRVREIPQPILFKIA